MMKNILQRLVRDVVSVLTTFVLMASPVAAIVYSSEPLEASNEFEVSDSAYANNLDAAIENADRSNKVLAKWREEVSASQPVSVNTQVSE